MQIKCHHELTGYTVPGIGVVSRYRCANVNGNVVVPEGFSQPGETKDSTCTSAVRVTHKIFHLFVTRTDR
jgi:hypothetical protein